MFTPQQIEQACFEKKTFGGYDMEQVDAFLHKLSPLLAKVPVGSASLHV